MNVKFYKNFRERIIIMYLKEIIASINTDTREKAETLLKTEGFMSLQDFEGGYEAFIAT